MEEFVQYWHDEFDWREQERRLNEFDQFKTNIDGLDIHFIESPDIKVDRSYTFRKSRWR